MKVCRFQLKTDSSATPLYGSVQNERVRRLASAEVYNSDLTLTEESFELKAVTLLPFSAPSKIICVGRNYAEHAKELGNEVPAEPLLFLKAPSSLIIDEEPIVLPPQSARVEHEGELGVIIKRSAKNLTEAENPLDYVLGYTCLNDVTARDLQRRDVQFTRAKSFDTFCPVGAVIETDVDPRNLELTLRVNGAVKQQGNTAQMVFPVADLIRYISRQMTLLPGDIIATGTPAGVSELKAGDVCEITIENVGRLLNPVTV